MDPHLDFESGQGDLIRVVIENKNGKYPHPKDTSGAITDREFECKSFRIRRLAGNGEAGQWKLSIACWNKVKN